MKITILLSLVGLVCGANGAGAAPCVAPGEACVQWVALDGGSARTRLYSTHSLTTKDTAIRSALIIVHGGGRDAEPFFRVGIAAALNADALNSTLVIAPRFASSNGSCGDRREANEVDWDCGVGSSGGWRAGLPAVSHNQFTSFDVVDGVLRSLNRRELFPNLRTIVVAGFSAGGQFVSRYAATNNVHSSMQPQVRYVVASPSSFLYPSSQRPVRGKPCAEEDVWPFGLQRIVGYAAQLPVETIRAQLVSRPITYVVGELDGPQAPALDTSCAAMAQGASRLERAQSFHKVITAAGAKPPIIIVPQCGHNAACIFIGRDVRPILFPPQ